MQFFQIGEIFMKKFILLALFASVLATSAFAASEKNKLGFYLGLPSGISYTRDLGKSADFDVLAGFDFLRTKDFHVYGYGLHARFAPLFKLWSGNLGSIMTGTFSLGPGFGFQLGGDSGTLVVGYSISLPIRFELDFKIPFSLFFETAPGFSHTFVIRSGSGHVPAFYLGGGLGLRFRF